MPAADARIKSAHDGIDYRHSGERRNPASLSPIHVMAGLDPAIFFHAADEAVIRKPHLFVERGAAAVIRPNHVIRGLDPRISLRVADGRVWARP